ncbi:putative disease resistance protein RGA3 [Rhodamnia argentea]|uniref:Disease resistance protein RGA3 n=1 Tax=Rhodamnia argentea TaxID=178133 RepID=A0ABM3HA46_9MYRT|nr:putative disease resistance protein RGA3 [Rhodamnia argentea]
MAGAALSCIATAILKSLTTEIAKPVGTFASQKVQSLLRVKDDLRSLKGTVETIQAVLLDAEKKQWHNNQVKHWLGRLKDVLYDLQDLLDDVATEDLRRKVTLGNKMSKAVRVFFSKSNQLEHRLRVANKIQELRKTLDEIEKDSKLLNLERHPEETVAIGRGKKPEHPSPDEKIIGREEDKMKIKQLLLSSSSNKSVSFVAIVGKGGLGKTALARLVYNDGEVKEHFGLKMWVCVSDVFDVNSIIKEILKKANVDCQGHDDEDLPSLLRETLRGEKYLLVLDDLWNEDRNKWLKLGDWLEGGLRGSKVLLTTRSHRVAEVTDARSVIHVLRGLSEDKPWNLFKKMAFGDGAESSDPGLEEIGRDIVKKCAGVPLAIRTVGGLLYGKTKDEWLRYKVRELPEIQEIDEADDGIMQVLKFSYDHLRSSLKHCFAYCSLFPKDYVYSKEMVIHLWVAQGFIESPNGEDNLEEVADMYLSELLCRSFLDVHVKFKDGEVWTFKMHDLMHDLAQKVAGGECKIVNFKGGHNERGIRHALFTSEFFSEEKMMSLLDLHKLQTLIFLGDPSHVLNFDRVFSEGKHCRVLHLDYVNIRLPPSSFEKLKHLRYLRIGKNESIQSLPDSITDLVNLQFLELFDCRCLKTFPRDLRKLINLQYLRIWACASVSHLPSLSELPSLRTLILFDLHGLEFVQQTSDVGQSKTARTFFPSLERLELKRCTKLKGWWGSRELMTAHQKHHRSSFPKLRSVKIWHCPHLNFVPPFPQVECLDIDDAKMLEIKPDPNCPSKPRVGSTFTPFSKLMRLYLHGDDPESRMLETLLRSANNLELMSLTYCDIRSFSRGMRHLSSLRELHVDTCEGLDLLCEEDQHDTQWPFLTNLRVLKITDLMQLPEGIRHVKTTQSLKIRRYRGSSLQEWIGNLSLLEKLVLIGCRKLEHLPFEMPNLTHLKELRIIRCPITKKNRHEERPQLAHIPVIFSEDEVDESDYESDYESEY